MNKKEAGFGVIEILIIVALVAIVGVGGWYVWQSQQAKKDSTQQTNQTSANADMANIEKAEKEANAISTRATASIAPGAEVTFADWNISAKNNSSYTLQYKISDNNKSIYFTSAELVAADPKPRCGISADNNWMISGGGRITRYLPNDLVTGYDSSGPPQAAKVGFSPSGNYKKINDDHYYYVHPFLGCARKSDMAPGDIEVKTDQAVKDLLGTFVAK